ncbi:MAG: PilZ domain-containing protein [Terriglobales bacterium]
MQATGTHQVASFDAGLAETQAKLARLERSEWWRWTTVLIISVALTIGVIAMAYPHMRPAVVSDTQLETILQSLLGLVLLFDVFAFYQQFRISKMRRELAAQIGMLSTLEVLRPPNPLEEVQRQNRRKAPRFLFDARLKITMKSNPKKQVFGRTRDISETGLGAVIADPLEGGDRVILEFPVQFQDHPVVVHAVVCYRRGFHHGFELLAPEAEQSAVIRQICRMGKAV